MDAGQVVSLIGESGSGKTTIGRMILPLAQVTHGTITFDGQDVARLPRKAYYRTVQGVFQDPFSSYNPIFKANHVVRHDGRMFPGLPNTESGVHVEASLQGVGLEARQVLHKYPHQLSGGQLQRLLIARALLLDIRLLVADEIVSMLDASTRIDVLNLLGNLKARGLGILFITHDLSLGYYSSQRTVILHGARVAIGCHDRGVRAAPASLYPDAHRVGPAAAQEVGPQRGRLRRRVGLDRSRDRAVPLPRGDAGRWRGRGWSARLRAGGGRGRPFRGLRAAERGRHHAGDGLQFSG